MLRIDPNKRVKWGIALTLVLVPLYRAYSPSESAYFPKCPFRELTGLECPGCGSQRAVHHLLNFDFVHAFESHAILVLSIPYLLTGLLFDALKNPSEAVLRWRKRLFGQRAIFVVLTVLIAFWVLRNIY